MAPPRKVSPLTRLDVLLIVTLALVAFAASGLWGPPLARLVFGPADPMTTFESDADLPARRHQVATLDRQLLKLRDRIAIEDVARIAEPATSARRAATILRLEQRAGPLVRRQAQARVLLGRAELRARRAWTTAESIRRLEEGLGRTVIAFVVLALTTLLAAGLCASARLPIALRWVAGGSALVLLGVLLADALGLVAALALAAVAVIIVLWQGATHDPVRAGRTPA